MKSIFGSSGVVVALALGTLGFAGEISFRFVNPSKADCLVSWQALRETWLEIEPNVSVAEAGTQDAGQPEGADGLGLLVPAGQAATFRIQHPDEGHWVTAARFEVERASASSGEEDLIPCGFDYSLKVDRLGMAAQAFLRCYGVPGVESWDADDHEVVYDGEAVAFTRSDPRIVSTFEEEPVGQAVPALDLSGLAAAGGSQG